MSVGAVSDRRPGGGAGRRARPAPRPAGHARDLLLGLLRPRPAAGARSIRSGDVVRVEAVTHHAGDAPDLLMDDGIRGVWAGIPEADRGPGVHVMTGPDRGRGRRARDTLARPDPRGDAPAAVRLQLRRELGSALRRVRQGAHHDLRADDDDGRVRRRWPRPMFAYDFTHPARYDVPGVVTPPDPSARQPFSRAVERAGPPAPRRDGRGAGRARAASAASRPARSAATSTTGASGPGRRWPTRSSPQGAGLYVGDPHLAQGDGEICGTAIEASLDVTLQVFVLDDLAVTAPVLETASHWFAHGFGDDLDEAMRMAAEQALWLARPPPRALPRRRLLAGVGGGRLRRHPGRRRQARLPRRHPDRAVRLTPRSQLVCPVWRWKSRPSQ